MNKWTIGVLTLATSASIGLAAGADAIKERRALMKENGEVTKPIVGMFKGAPLDLPAVQKALKAYINASEKMPALFPPDSMTGDTNALPAIWDNKVDLDARFKKLAKDQAGAVTQVDLDKYQSTEDAAVATLEQSQANLVTAKPNFDWTKVTAPVAGVIGRLLVTRGNLIVARTFSKIYGMAGLRCGYCVTRPENIKLMNEHQVWDSINIMAIVAALAHLAGAGLVFAILDVGLGWALRGISPWTPLRMIGAIVLGPAVLSPPDTFDPAVALVAIFIHLMLSTIYGTLLALLMPAVDIAWAILLGGFYGLALYYINFYGFNAFSPWFAEQRDWVSIASHFVFGAVLAYAYTALNTRELAVRQSS